MARSPLVPWSQLRASLEDDHTSHRLYQREMGERLREVPEVPRRLRVVFFGIEAERRGDPQQPLHQVAGPLYLSDDRKGRHEPERADHERSFVAGKSVVGLGGTVTQNKAVLGQFLGDGENGVPQASVVMRQELETPCQQRRGVE